MAESKSLCDPAPEPVMWCACNCGERVRPSDFHVKDETTGTNVYYVDRGHYLSTDPWGFQRYSRYFRNGGRWHK